MLVATLPSLLVLSPAVPLAQTPSVPIRAGDAIATGDIVTAILSVQIDDSGSWLALVDTNAPDLAADSFLLRDGEIVQREGDGVPGLPGATVDEFEALASGPGGDIAAIQVIRFFSLVSAEGLFFNAQPVALESEPVGTPEVPATATWDLFQALRLSRTRTLLVLGEILNPDVVGVREDTLARFQLDASGAVLSQNVLLTKGQHLPVVNATVSSLGSLADSFDLNDRGDFLAAVFLAGQPAAILKNADTVLAREGAPSPVPGRSYSSFGPSKMSLNEFDEYAFTARLYGTENTHLVVRNGQAFAQQGDALPFFAAPLGGWTPSPLRLSNAGDLYWGARDANAQNETFVRGMVAIVQEGTSVVDGHVVTQVELDETGFHSSPDGRFWAGRVELEGVGEALVTADFGLVLPLPGCAGNGGRLRKASGDARVGERLTLELDGAQALGAVPVLVVGTRPAVPDEGCGLPIPGGELLVDPTSVFAIYVGPPWTGTPVPFAIDIPLRLDLVDRQVFAQGAFLASGGAARRFLPTNGLRLELGAP